MINTLAMFRFLFDYIWRYTSYSNFRQYIFVMGKFEFNFLTLIFSTIYINKYIVFTENIQNGGC